MRRNFRRWLKTSIVMILSISMSLTPAVTDFMGVSVVYAEEDNGAGDESQTEDDRNEQVDGKGNTESSSTEKENELESSEPGDIDADEREGDEEADEQEAESDNKSTGEENNPANDGGELSDSSVGPEDESDDGTESSNEPAEGEDAADDTANGTSAENESGITDDSQNIGIMEADSSTSENELTDDGNINDEEVDGISGDNEETIAESNDDSGSDVSELGIIDEEVWSDSGDTDLEAVMTGLEAVITENIESVPAEEEIEEYLIEDEELLYDWEFDWEMDLNAGDIWTSLDFSSSDDPASVMEAFGTSDSKNNIEGPEGSNCAVDGADNWRDNGNLMVVDLASASDAASSEEAYDGAGETARMSLNDTHVFQFYLHDTKDWDRNTSIVDRQRIEIKTDAKNADINSYAGEILTNRWKFFLPEGYPLPQEGSFFHIFQTKATQGDESSMPVFTLSVTDERLTLCAADFGHVDGQEEEVLTEVSIDDILGRWIEAELTTYTAEKGYVYLRLRDVSDPMDPEILVEEGFSADSWRRPEEHCEDGFYHEYDAPAVSGQMNRSKWGLYRKNDSPVPFCDMTMYLGDLQIIKRNEDEYVFPDGFDPKEQSLDIYWAVEPDSVSVLEGTDFSNIYLPSSVDVYVNGCDVETLGVVWEAGDYNQAVRGTYTIYGTLQLTDGIENPDDVKASMKIVVTDDISQTRVNWALGTQQGGTAQLKTVGGSASNPSENLIDGSDDTWWATHSGLIEVNTEDNGGYRYWAAIDLGAERTFDEIEIVFGTIGSSKQFRLKNYSMYDTNDSEAYDELIGGTTGNPREKGVTPDPLVTEHGTSWESIPGVYKENVNGSKEVTNNADHTFRLEEEHTSRYILIYGEIENVDATAGAIQTKLLRVAGDKATEEIPEIAAVENPDTLVVGTGTEFDALGLPDELTVQLADGTTGNAQVSWNQGDYQKDMEGSYRIVGTISFPDDQMQNPEHLKAEMVIIVDNSVNAEKVNWATVEQGATLKVVSESKAKEADWTTGYLIDGDDTTAWQTNSSLMKLGDDCVYWTAIDLGQKRSVDELRLGWLTTNRRLKNYAVYEAEDTEEAEEAFDQLTGKAGTINSLEEITPDPLEESDVWNEIEGMVSGNAVTNNTVVDKTFDEPLNCRYLMVRAELDLTVSAGAIHMAFLEAYGNPEITKTEITGIVEPDAVAVVYGTPFGEIDLPETVEAELSDGTTETIAVIWNKDGYSRTQTGTVWISGTLICPVNIANTGDTKAVLQLNIEGSEIARRASVVFMSSSTEEYCRYDEVIVGSIITAPVNEPIRDGYEFTGWYRDMEGTKAWVSGGEKLTAAGLILYAGWKKSVSEETEEGEQQESKQEEFESEESKQPYTEPEETLSEETDADEITQPETTPGSQLPSDSAGKENLKDDKDSDDHNDSTYGRKQQDETEAYWVQDQKGWWYSDQGGSWPCNEWRKLTWNGRESWYYFGRDGYMKTGWFQDSEGYWYYLNPKADGTQGEMLIGWHRIDGTWFYFEPQPGKMQGVLMVTDYSETANHTNSER